MFRNQPLYCLPWLVVGCAWLVQFFVPWTTSGTLSASSMVDVVGLIRAGTLGPSVPGWAMWAVLAVPVTGLVLVACSAFEGVAAQWVRALLAAVGTAAAVAVTQGLVGNELSRLGPGGYLVWVGVACALGGVLTDARQTSKEG